jgi:internalin A
MAQLQRLELNTNELTDLPSEIGLLTQLKELHLYWNRLSQLPHEVGQLTQLQQLNLSNNQLTQLPPKIGQLIQLQWLNLSNNQLTQLPPKIGQLIQLQWLNINENDLTDLPPEIGLLNQLRALHLYRNRLSQLPHEVGQLTQLQQLNFHYNRLSQLPFEIGQLTQLQQLNLSNNQLTQLPPETGQLTQLQQLDLSNNQLTQLPPEIGQLTQLQQLDLSNNQLTQLPPEIGQLTQLQRLCLGKNKLTQLLPRIEQLTQLQQLYLNNNRLTRLPTEIGQLRQLHHLNLKNNPLSLPPEILKKVDEPIAILDYIAAFGQGKRPLHEAKMLLVGQGGVGKTSLVKRLISNEYDEHESKTEGIAIAQWSVKTPDNENIRVNIWDFGGQEIMHATHQFFMTKRSLYLLVLDARQGEQESRVEYWLKLIQSFADDSPILVAINKADQHRLDINRKGLSAKYPNIQGFFDASCKTGRGLDKLKQQIEDSILKLPHVHDRFPKSWFGIKEQLGCMKQDLQKDYLSYDEYVHLCKQRQVADTSSQRTLLNFLHDLGIVLCFHEDRLRPQLADTGILNPEWVTQGVYTLLNHETLAEDKGVLEVSQLDKLLDSQRYPRNKRHVILEIMEKFELCFEYEQRGRYLIPELLPKEEPNLQQWNDATRLQFQYHYDVLPTSVISRFIVKTHHLIFEKIYWHTGVVLTQDNNQALVKADIEDKKIFINVRGNDKGRRSLLAVIRSKFDEIHKTIPKINPVEHVPYKTITIRYRHLLTLERLGEETLIPEGLAEKVSVKQLLDGIRTKSSNTAPTQPAPIINIYGDNYMSGDQIKVGNISGSNITNLGTHNVATTIQQLPDSANKEILMQIQALIQQSQLTAQDKEDALDQLAVLADPDQKRSSIRAAINFLRDIGVNTIAELLSKYLMPQ